MITREDTLRIRGEGTLMITRGGCSNDHEGGYSND